MNEEINISLIRALERFRSGEENENDLQIISQALSSGKIEIIPTSDSKNMLHSGGVNFGESNEIRVTGSVIGTQKIRGFSAEQVLGILNLNDKSKDGNARLVIAILIGLIVAIAFIVAGYLEFRGSIEAALIPIRATETAEAKIIALEGLPTENVSPIKSPTITPLSEPTYTPLPTYTRGPATTQPEGPITVELPFMVDESGWVTHWGQIGTGELHPPQAGDFMNNAIARGFLSFDLSSIPSNANIHSAILTIPKDAVEQEYGDLFPNFGSLLFESVWYGLSLNPEAFDTPGYVVLQNVYGLPGSTMGVAAGIEHAVKEGYSRFQIRFSFSLGTDNDDDGEVYGIPVSRGQGGIPTLELTYFP